MDIDWFCAGVGAPCWRPEHRPVGLHGREDLAAIDDVRMVPGEGLQLGEKALTFEEPTPLPGCIPELDSMALIARTTALEERFDRIVDGDEITADVFDSLGRLSALVERKMASWVGPAIKRHDASNGFLMGVLASFSAFAFHQVGIAQKHTRADLLSTAEPDECPSS